MDDFADRVRYARVLRKMSQARLSRAAHLDPATVFRIEKGESRAHASTAHKLAEALKVSAEWLLTGAEHLRPVVYVAKPANGQAPTQTKTLYTRGSLKADAVFLDDDMPQAIPLAVVQTIMAHPELLPMTDAELRLLCSRHNADGLRDPAVLELQLLMHRVAMTSNSPEATAAWHKAVQRQEAERAAVHTLTVKEPAPAPDRLKKHRS